MNFNITFLYLGLTIIGIGILGFIVYLNNKNSATNKSFLFIAISTIFLGLFNFLYHQPNLGDWALIFLRIHMFFAVWHAFSMFNLYYVFPKTLFNYSKKFKFILFPWIVFVSILTLTPLVFEKIESFDSNGIINRVKTNYGIIFFGLTIFVLLTIFIVGFIVRLYKTKEKILRYQYFLIFIGAFLTFCLHIYFNFVLPNFFQNNNFTSLGAIYSFPFILFASYAILKYKFLNIKIIINDFFVVILLVLAAIQTLNSQELSDILFKFLIFIFIFIFGIINMRSVRLEVEQKEKLTELNRELESLNKIKSEFLSFASHQLKSPMAVIKGYVTLMTDGTIPNVPDQVKDFASKIKKSIDDLLVLIEEFMDYRKIDENKMDFNFEEVEIVDFVRDIFENYKLIAKNKNLEFSFENNVSEAKVLIDKIRFAQVVQNLIDNALKYTKQGFVKVCLNEKDDNILICVRDSGIGMTKELQEKLFSQFVRDPEIKKEIQGTGLGLYIAKYIVENHKGKIWAESEGKDKGSQFYIQIPKIQNNS
jgi:signal transduction histidine kinase